MKSKITFVLLLALLTGILSGCSSAQPQAAAASADLSPKMKTGLGILSLEGQSLAVDVEQAKELLPLWQALLTLSTDANTTPEEITVINDQIRETLSAEQLKAIDQMKWDEQELTALLQKYQSASSQANAGAASAQSASASSAAMDGGMPGAGGPPPEAGGSSGLMTGADTQVTTSHAEIPGQSERLTAGGINLVVAPAVIHLLQSKMAA